MGDLETARNPLDAALAAATALAATGTTPVAVTTAPAETPITIAIKKLTANPDELIKNADELMKVYKALRLKFTILNINSKQFGFIFTCILVGIELYARFFATLYVFDLVENNSLVTVLLVLYAFMTLITVYYGCTIYLFNTFMCIVGIIFVQSPVNSTFEKVVIFYGLHYVEIVRLTLTAI